MTHWAFFHSLSLSFRCRFTDLSFDLSPLTEAFYNLTSGDYNYYINVCGAVKFASCPEKAGACQVEQRPGNSDRWTAAAQFSGIKNLLKY